MASILRRIADDDPDAVQECIDEYGGLVWSIARRLLGHGSEAEDAVQEAFIDIWKSAGRFDPKLASEKTYVAMLARRRIIDRLRKLGRRPETSLPDAGELPVDAADRSIERGAEARIAARALQELPEARRRVLELTVLHGFTHREAAATLDMPLGTVKTHIGRGLARVREILLSPEAEVD